MAFKEYLAVLDSDLYEYCGTTKAILARIAHLIIGPPEEGPNGKPLTDPSPDEGLCIATQAYLACQLGVSESTVRAAVQQYAEDGWLIVHKFRDRRGHERNNYSFAPGALATIQARKRQRDEHGEYIRSKQLKMQRAHSSGQFAGRVTRVNEASTTRDARVNTAPPSNLHAGLQADCATASKQIARQPPGKLPAVVGVVGLVVGLEGGIVSKSQSKTKGASDNTSSASLTDQDQNQTPSTPWDDEEEPAPVNPTPKPRGAAPNLAEGFSPSGLPGTSSPVNSASPRPHSAPPRNRVVDMLMLNEAWPKLIYSYEKPVPGYDEYDRAGRADLERLLASTDDSVETILAVAKWGIEISDHWFDPKRKGIIRTFTDFVNAYAPMSKQYKTYQAKANKGGAV